VAGEAKNEAKGAVQKQVVCALWNDLYLLCLGTVVRSPARPHFNTALCYPVAACAIISSHQHGVAQMQFVPDT
jgi:hypothetical protein